MNITYSQEIIGFINIFEKVTRASVKDCFLDNNSLVFVVQPMMLRKALGKNGANVKRLAGMFNKPIKVIEFNPNPVKFVQNLLYPVKPQEIKEEGDTVVIVPKDTTERGKIYGRNKTNFAKIRSIFSKYFKKDLELR